jgi:hypothetical protein
VGVIHHHHALEEEFLFPELEKKLGKGALHGNIDQHTEFAPQLHDLEEYIKAVQNGKQDYNGDDFVEKINSFGDVLMQHLADVHFSPLASSASRGLTFHFQEIPTIETKYLQKHFTAKELQSIDDAFIRRAIKAIKFNTTIPLSLVCANPATPWYVYLFDQFSFTTYYSHYPLGFLHCRRPSFGLSACGSPGSMLHLGSSDLVILMGRLERVRIELLGCGLCT